MDVQIVQSFRTKPHNKLKHLSGGAGLGLYPDARYLIIRLPDSRVLKLLARSVILALFIVSFPCLGAISPSTSVSAHLESEGRPDQDHEVGVVDAINVELLPLFFRDLTNEGIFQKAQNAVFMSSANDEAIYRSQIMNDNEMEIISTKDSKRQSSIPNDTFDFVFVSSFPNNAEFIDRTLKVGGIVALQLNDDPSVGFQKPSNYKIVYLRRFDSTVLAMKKTGHASESGSTATQRRLFEYATEAKKAALNKLEDVLLEPPRAASGKSRRYLKKTRYLPDLMGDSLESYPRRVFIDVGLPEKDGGSGTGWFEKHYPTRNKDFEIYNIESVTSSPSSSPQIGMPEWLKRNVKEEEYVVMKSDAEVVEEMVKSKTIRLVDELFLECKPQGHGGKGNSSRRAYWECLALYGRLRDEGVAVHQWWG